MSKNNGAIIVAGVGGLAVIAFVAISFLFVGANTTSLKQPSNSNVQAGASLYIENCASCHGENLEGQPDWRSPNEDGSLPAPPHDERGHTWHHGDALLFEYTKLGGQAVLEASGATGFTSGMPGFEDQLSDEEIWDILAFIKSSWSERVRISQTERSEGE